VFLLEILWGEQLASENRKEKGIDIFPYIYIYVYMYIMIYIFFGARRHSTRFRVKDGRGKAEGPQGRVGSGRGGGA